MQSTFLSRLMNRCWYCRKRSLVCCCAFLVSSQQNQPASIFLLLLLLLLLSRQYTQTLVVVACSTACINVSMATIKCCPIRAELWVAFLFSLKATRVKIVRIIFHIDWQTLIIIVITRQQQQHKKETDPWDFRTVWLVQRQQRNRLPSASARCSSRFSREEEEEEEKNNSDWCNTIGWMGTESFYRWLQFGEKEKKNNKTLRWMNDKRKK